MTSSLFVDTSGWASIIHRQDPFHVEADRLFREAFANHQTVLTTDYVLAELVPLLSSHYKLTRAVIIAAIDTVLSDPRITFVRTDPTTFDDAWNLLRGRQDKDWSLTDAISMVVMRRLGVSDCLTTDHHFEQAGFVRLLR